MKKGFLKLSTLGFSSILLLNSIVTPVLLATKINVSDDTNHILRSRSSNLIPIENISEVFKNINLDDWNKSTIDFTDYKASVNIKNEDPYTKIKQVLDEANSKDYISMPNNIKVKNDQEIMFGYRQPSFEYLVPNIGVVMEQRLFGINDYKNSTNYYQKNNDNQIIDGYFFSDDVFGNNINYPKTFFQLVTQKNNEVKWIWEDEKFSNKLKELIKTNFEELKKVPGDTYLWFVQKGTSIERRDNPTTINPSINENDKTIINQGWFEGNIEEFCKLAKDASIELIDVTRSQESYSTQFIKEEVKNGDEVGLNIKYRYSKTPSEENDQDLKEENYKFEDGFAFYVCLPGNEKIHPMYKDRNIKAAIFETSVGDLTFNDLINKNIKNIKNNLFTKFEKIETTYDNPYNKKIRLFKDPNSNKFQTVSSYKMNLEVANESNKIWYNDQDYTLKNQKLKALINDEELNIQNFIVPKWNNNQIIFEFNDIFKEMFLNIYNLSYLASKLHQEKNKLNKINNLQISYQEAFKNQWNNSNPIWSTKWYTNAVNEFNIYLKEASAYNSNSEDYEWSYLLKWIKDFFSEDIYINYANENIKIWDSKSFSFISFNIKENQNTINKMYKNSNSNLNLINKLKIEDNSKFNISNGNLVILNNNNNNNSAPTLKNISEANVTFENNKNSFEYTGDPIKPSIELKTSDNKLIETQNYTLTYSNNINVGQATILIKGQNNYTGQKEVTFNITKANNEINLFGIDNNNNIIVKSIFGTPYLKYYLDKECKNEVTELTNNRPTNSGTYYVKAFVDGTENYNSTSSEVIEYIISSESNLPNGEENPSIPDNGIELEILFNDGRQIEYTGSEIKPNIEIRLQEKKLEEGKDFKLTFSNNINVGQATIEIIGMGNFKGMKLKQIFSITKAKNPIKVKYDKNQNIPEITSSFGEIKKLEYFSDQECKNKLDKKPTQPGTYYAKVFVDGTENYEKVEEVIEFQVKKQNNQVKKQNNIPIIVGSILGSLAGVGIICFLIIFILNKRKKSK